jgi:hypothetical protein
VESSLDVQYHIPRKLVEGVLLLLHIRKFVNFNLGRAQTIMAFLVIFFNPWRQTSGQCLREATEAPSSLLTNLLLSDHPTVSFHILRTKLQINEMRSEMSQLRGKKNSSNYCPVYLAATRQDCMKLSTLILIRVFLEKISAPHLPAHCILGGTFVTVVTTAHHWRLTFAKLMKLITFKPITVNRKLNLYVIFC